MKKNSILTVAILAIVVSFLFVSLNVGSTYAKGTAKAKQISMTSMLERSDTGYMLKTAKHTVTVEGKEDFAPMVDKEVKVWGTMKKGAKTPTMEVAKIEEVKKK